MIPLRRLIPPICLAAATVLAVRPAFAADAEPALGQAGVAARGAVKDAKALRKRVAAQAEAREAKEPVSDKQKIDAVSQAGISAADLAQKGFDEEQRLSLGEAIHQASLRMPNYYAEVAKVRGAGLELYTLMQKGYEPHHWGELGRALGRAGCAVGKLHDENSNVLGDFYGSGTVANIAGTFTLDLKRGCLAHQSATFDALGSADHLTFRKIKAYQPFPHHAVIVFPKNDGLKGDKLSQHWRKSGIILDAWIEQSSKPSEMTFLFEDWDTVARGSMSLE